MNPKIELYGLSIEERKRLHFYWYKLVGTESEAAFGGFEDFAKWASENGFALGKHLVPIDLRKPITPTNAYWKYVGEKVTDAEMAARVTLTEHPCETCPRNNYCDKACYLRKKWWDMGMEKLRKRLGL